MIQHHLSIRTETKTKILVAYITRTAPLNWNSTNQRWIFSPTFFVSNFYLLVNSIIELHFVNPWGHQFSLRFIVRFSYYWLLTRYIYFFFFLYFSYLLEKENNRGVRFGIFYVFSSSSFISFCQINLFQILIGNNED